MWLGSNLRGPRKSGLFFGGLFLFMKKTQEISFEGTYNPHKNVISIDGEGSAEIKFTTDASQLASVLSSLANLKDSRILISLKKICGDKVEKRKAKKYR